MGRGSDRLGACDGRHGIDRSGVVWMIEGPVKGGTSHDYGSYHTYVEKLQEVGFVISVSSHLVLRQLLFHSLGLIIHWWCCGCKEGYGEMIGCLVFSWMKKRRKKLCWG